MEALIEEIRQLVSADNPFDADEDLRCVRNQIMMLRPEKARVGRIVTDLTALYNRCDDGLLVRFDQQLREMNCAFVQAPLLGWHLQTPVGYIQIDPQ